MHNIEHWSYPENCDRKSVFADACEYAQREGDGYTGPIHWHDEVEPLKSWEEAEKWIEAHDKGWYDDHAVRYVDRSSVKTKKSDEIADKISKLMEKQTAYAFEHSVKKFKAEYVGCGNCGSKLKRSLLRSDRCPLCGEDLRSKTTLETLANYDKKMKELMGQMEEEKRKHGGVVKWLVKIEFHS